MKEQLLLDFIELVTTPSFNNYIPTNNEIIIASLQSFSHQYVHLIGNNNTGKTHLLQAWVSLSNQDRPNQAIYVNAKTCQSISLLLHNYRFFAIDNIEELSESNQEALFNLYNHAKILGHNIFILTSSNKSVNSLLIREDLKTRVSSGIVFNIKTMLDVDLINALAILTKKQGIMIGNAEINYIVTHYSRNLGHQIRLIMELDKQAMQYKKNITIPFIKNIIQQESL